MQPWESHGARHIGPRGRTLGGVIQILRRKKHGLPVRSGSQKAFTLAVSHDLPQLVKTQAAKRWQVLSPRPLLESVRSAHRDFGRVRPVREPRRPPGSLLLYFARAWIVIADDHSLSHIV